MMDGVFGHQNFRNEIIWYYQTGGASKRWFSRKHDSILFYAKTKNHTFNSESVKVSRSEKSLRRAQNPKGARISSADTTKLAPDVWTDVAAMNPMSKERLGYATQKPLALLNRIICASTNKGDVVLDPFCGCGTTIEAADKLKRRWIGIDIAFHAIRRVTQVRLRERCNLLDGRDFEIEGVPLTLEGAQYLWEQDKYHFQQWAIEQVDGFVTSKRTADGGIDGRLYFDIPGEGEFQSMVIEVKGGESVNIGVMRDLRGVLEREDALLAGLIVMKELGTVKARNFKREMASAGDLEVNGKFYPRMQMLTVADILDGQQFKTPGAVGRGESQMRLGE